MIRLIAVITERERDRDRGRETERQRPKERERESKGERGQMVTLNKKKLRK